MANPIACLICNIELDSRPIIFNGGDGGDSKKRLKFQLGLQLVCKLLKIGGRNVDKIFTVGGRGEDDTDTVRIPCCEKCCRAFEQMLRLQQDIEELKANLLEQLDKLKTALKTSVPTDYQEDPLKIPADDIFGKIRDQLVSCVRKPITPIASSTVHNPGSKKRKQLQSPTKSSKGPHSKIAKEYQSCSVILKCLPPNLLNSYLKSETLPQEENWSDLNLEEYVPSPEAPSPIQSNHDDDPNDNNDEDEYPWESEAEPIPEPFTLTNQNRTGRRKTKLIPRFIYPSGPSILRFEADQFSEEISPIQIKPAKTRTCRSILFSLISPDTLLYQYTLIKVSQGYTHFTCQEPECPSPHFSDLSLNWNNLFSQIVDHITSVHVTAPQELERKCPLCPNTTTLLTGPQFRGHLTGVGKTQEGGHRIDTVVCDICWRPIRNLADAYRRHQWLHKNSKEMEESLEGPPPGIVFRHKANNKFGRKSFGKLKIKPKMKANLKVNFKAKHKNPSAPVLVTGINCDEGARSIRKSKLKAFEFIRKCSTSQNINSPEEDNCSDLNEEKYVPSPEAPSPIQDNHEDENLVDGIKPIYSENLANQLRTRFSRRTKFYLISPDTLFYQFTLIKVSQNYTHFTCQEPNCPSPNFSEDPLNWTNLFSQIADHIKSTHITSFSMSRFSYKQVTKVKRKCPLCPKTISRGPPFRAHLIGTGKNQNGHRIKTIICDICLKPIRNQADAYRRHQWTHKSDQDKEQCPEGPPPVITKQIKIKNDKSKVKCKPKPKWKLNYKKNYPKKKVIIGENCDHFSKIVEDKDKGTLLIYKYTLVKVLYGVSLTCQEISCGHIINGTDLTALELFKNHVNNCHDNRNANALREQANCPLCPSEDLRTWTNFRSHLLDNCQGNYNGGKERCPFICIVCGKPMKSEKSLEYHQWLHKSDLEKEAVKQVPMLVTFKEKQRQVKLKCDQCDKEFKTATHLRAHQLIHMPKEQRKWFGCPQCPQKFLDQRSVQSHVEREHEGKVMRVRTCPICSKEFDWRAGYKFRSHMRSHRNERPFVCELCGKAFFDGMQLKGHKKKVHEDQGERPWQCEFCEMNYKQRYHLGRHRRSAHKEEVGEEGTEEKRLKYTTPEYREDFIGPRIAFPCPVCEKVFPLRSRMKKHWEMCCKG